MKACLKCGIEKDESEFYTYKSTGRLRSPCKSCHVADCVARAASDPIANNARSKAWRQANPEKAAATVRARREESPAKFDSYAKWTRYRIDFYGMWRACGGLCASCGKPMLSRGKDPESVCVDHDRSCCSGKKSCGRCVRGLIHRNCNLVLGYAKDDLAVLEAAVEYLKRWRRQS